MINQSPTFQEEIEKNKSAELIPDDTAHIETAMSYLEVRKRGCFITDCELTNILSNDKVSILHCDPDLSVPKLTASHMMMPVGPSEGIGGQHGFPRWADYHEFPICDGDSGEKRIAFQAKRSDLGLGLMKVFEMTENILVSDTTATNYESDPAHTSLGEHLYFSLESEKIDGLLVDGHTLDQWLGEGAQKDIMDGKPIFWDAFGGDATIDFPAGHSIGMDVQVTGAPQETVGMLIWHRPGSESICFEPTAGYSDKGSDGLELKQNETAMLSTRIILLPK